MTSSNGNIFRVTGPLRGEFTGYRWIPLTKASNAELSCFLSSAPIPTVEQTMETPVIWDDIALIRRQLYDNVTQLPDYHLSNPWFYTNVVMSSVGHNVLTHCYLWVSFRNKTIYIRQFNSIFMKENVWIAIRISMKFSPMFLVNNIPGSIRIMTWHWTGDEPLFEPMIINLLTHLCVSRP